MRSNKRKSNRWRFPLDENYEFINGQFLKLAEFLYDIGNDDVAIRLSYNACPYIDKIAAHEDGYEQWENRKWSLKVIAEDYLTCDFDESNVANLYKWAKLFESLAKKYRDVADEISNK